MGFFGGDRQTLRCLQDFPALLKQDLSGLRQHGLPAFHAEQDHIQILFQFLYGIGNGRRHPEQFIARCDKTTFPIYGI